MPPLLYSGSNFTQLIVDSASRHVDKDSFHELDVKERGCKDMFCWSFLFAHYQFTKTDTWHTSTDAHTQRHVNGKDNFQDTT